MAFGDLQRARYEVNVVTTRYYYSGQIQPLGEVLVWLNDPGRGVMPLYSAVGLALDEGCAVDQIRRDELQILKADIVAVDLLSAEAREGMVLMPRTEQLVFYSERFAFNATCPMRGEARVTDMLDGMKGDFFPLVAAQVFPLRAVRPPMFRTSQMLLLSRQHLLAYHSL